VNTVATSIFIGIFLFITVLGFVASHWHKAQLSSLKEWGLAGNRFGTLISWFLVGGDLYTAYTFIAVPALIFGVGALGFFAVPYTFFVYPFAFLVLPRLWAISKRNGYVTPADLVQARFNSKALGLIVAITGILATMPYIALQLIGIQVVISALGFPTTGFFEHFPLAIAFITLAAYTYSSGIRAPALIAIVKDLLIYITVIAAIVIIPAKLGGFAQIFSHITPEKLLLKPPSSDSLNEFSIYFTLPLGSALALFLYPHSQLAILTANGTRAIRRNMLLLPAYSILLGLIALLGVMADAAGVNKMPEFAGYFNEYKAQFAVPALFLTMFPDWFVGVAFAAIAIGALVPAAIMSIAAANLFTRNIYVAFIRPNSSPEHETKVAKITSLLVKLGTLLFVIEGARDYAIQLQLLGGVWIIQTLPAVILGLYVRLNKLGLLLGWAAGICFGTYVVYTNGFKNAIYVLTLWGYKIPGYVALYALILNLLVACLFTLLNKGKIHHSERSLGY